MKKGLQSFKEKWREPACVDSRHFYQSIDGLLKACEKRTGEDKMRKTLNFLKIPLGNVLLMTLGNDVK